jgi:AraC-like DNA-binding protein
MRRKSEQWRNLFSHQKTWVPGSHGAMKSRALASGEEIHYSRPSALDGAEFVRASSGPRSFPRHFHEEYSITIMVGGVERFRHGGTTSVAPAGSLILVNPGEVHQKECIDNARFSYRTLFVPVSVVQRILREAGVYTATFLPGLAETVVFDRTLFLAFQRLHSGVERDEPAARLQTLLLVGITQLFRRHACAQACPEPRPSSHSTITRVKEYIDTHFAEDVSLTDLARIAGLSSYHLLRCFRDAVGLPPCQYLIQRRVLHALGVLRRGAPIAIAALESGFVDQSHFHRYFKRFLGITPGQFRASARMYKTHSDIP